MARKPIIFHSERVVSQARLDILSIEVSWLDSFESKSSGSVLPYEVSGLATYEYR